MKIPTRQRKKDVLSSSAFKIRVSLPILNISETNISKLLAQKIKSRSNGSYRQITLDSLLELSRRLDTFKPSARPRWSGGMEPSQAINLHLSG